MPLRSAGITEPYFHSGTVWELEAAVAIMGTAQPGRELNQEQVEAITAFIASLTGAQPRVELPVLPERTEATPHPAVAPIVAR